MNKIAILGTGAWGTALANVLIKNQKEVYMWGINEDEVTDLNNGYNKKYFGNDKLFNKPIFATTNIKKIYDINPDFVILAFPSQFIETTLLKISNNFKNKPIYINVAKGLNQKTNSVWSKTIKKIIKGKSKGLVTLIGPSFAIEVFRANPTMINAISKNKSAAKRVATIFKNKNFKCIVNSDEIGAELSSALKNVMAIAMGIAYELHTSINTRAAMLAQATKEISYIVKLFKGKQETLLQFCGIGDIYLTCTDEKSRNFSFGKSIAKNGLKKTLANNKKTVEGYLTTKIIYQIIKSNDIDAPVFINTYNILYKNMDPKKFVSKIMNEVIE